MSIPTHIVYSYRGKTYRSAEAAEHAYERDMDHRRERERLSLTERRERIATAVLTAILSNPSETQAIANSEMGAAESRKGLTALSVRYADALIAELNRKGEEG